RWHLRSLLRDGHANEDESVSRIERVKVINEKDVLFAAGVLGKHAGEPAVVFFVESGAERAGQFEPGVQVKFVRLRRVRVFDLRAKALSQLLQNRAEGG